MSQTSGFLVVGATGRVGRALVSALDERGQAFRALVRNAGHDLGHDSKTEYVLGDLDEPATLATALRGVHTVFLLTPADPTQVQRECSFIDAARLAGVGRVVKLSVLGAGSLAPFAFGRSHGAIEEHLARSGMRACVLRPNGMFHNVLTQITDIRDHGCLVGCQGRAEVSLVDVRDVGRAAAAAMLNDHLVGTFHLTGPEAISAQAQAELLSRVLRKEIRYINREPADFKTSLIDRGAPEWLGSALVELSAFYGSGVAGTVSSDVESLGGVEPGGFGQWCADHSDQLVGSPS